MDRIELPNELLLMLQYGEKLAENFPFVRVDFFKGNEQLYLGELTFTPGGGLRKVYPNKFDTWLGSQLELSSVNYQASI